MNDLRAYKLQGDVPAGSPTNPNTWSKHVCLTLVAESVLRAVAMAEEIHPGIVVHNVQHHGKVDAVDGKTQLVDALREAWADVPSSGRVPNGMTWVHPLIQAATALVDPDGSYGRQPEVAKRGKVAEYKDRLAWAIEHSNMAEKVGSDAARDFHKAEALRIIADCKAATGVDLSPPSIVQSRTKTGEQAKAAT